MSYSALTIANTLVEKSINEGPPVTHMKLQKMAYCLHGWRLARFDKPAFAEPVKVWQYGPVVEEIYHEFKRFGRAVIDDFACKEDEDGALVYYTVAKANREFRELLDQAWQYYSPYTAAQLSTLTHRAGTPWEKAKSKGVSFIDNNEIARHFREHVGVKPVAPAAQPVAS